MVAEKNRVAVALVGMRWDKANAADRERQAQVLNTVRQALTPEQRKEIARNAARARWAKRKGEQPPLAESSSVADRTS